MKKITLSLIVILFPFGFIKSQTLEDYEIQGAKLGRKINRQIGESAYQRTVSNVKISYWGIGRWFEETGNHSYTSFVGAMDGMVMGSLAKNYSYQNYYHGDRGIMIRHNLKYSTDISALDIVNITYADDNDDGILSKDEIAEVYFDLINTGDEPIYGITPVLMSDKTKHVHISSPCTIDTLNANSAVRYVIGISGDGKMNPGKLRLLLRIRYGKGDYIDVQQIFLGTKRKKE